MNDNNLFDDNQNTNPFEQPIETTENSPTENAVAEPEEPVEIPVQEPAAVDLGINILNNVGANAPDVKQQVKKSVSKTPFIIIAVILLLSIFIGGGGYAVKTLVFDKAPNEIEVPDNDETHMIKDEEKEEAEEEEETEGEGENSENNDNDTENESENTGGSSNPNSGQEQSESETVEETVKREEKGQTKISIENFETDGTEQATFYTNDDKKIYEVNKISNDLVISVREAVDSDVEKGTSVELFRRTFAPIEYEDEEGNISLGSFTVYGSVVNSYVIIRADQESEGTYLIFDKNLNLIQEGLYDYTIVPTVTDEAIYYPKIECGNGNHKYTIHKLDVSSGKSSVFKTNKYENELLYCQ
jgi:hypothetical protein